MLLASLAPPEVLKPVGWSKYSKTSVTELFGEWVYPRTTPVHWRARPEHELQVENFGELWILDSPDVSAKESEDAGQRGLALIGWSEQLVEKAAVSRRPGESLSSIQNLEVVFAPQTVNVEFCVAGLSVLFLSIRSKRDTLQVKDVAVAHG